MMTTADVDWVVDLASRRRQRIVKFAPRFWQPAPGARSAHTSFMTGLIQASEVVSIRTDQGFVVGVPDRGRMVIDDMALEDDALWPTDGDVLLRQAARSGPLRVVCPVPEASRRTAVANLGLSVVETWWHRDLKPDPAPARTSGETRLVVGGAEARLLSAPPVYAPGGPVLLIATVATASALGAIERAARRRGSVVAVVSQQPDDQATADLLKSAGYKRTTDFFEGSVAN
jgi:hypothetical protein